MQEVKSDSSVRFGKVWNLWFFAESQAFIVCPWFLGAGPGHSQAGWSFVHAPLEPHEAYMPVRCVRDNHLHWHLWYPHAPTLFRWAIFSFMSGFWLIIDFMYIFLYLLAQILCQESPWNTRIQVSWASSLDERIRTTFWVYEGSHCAGEGDIPSPCFLLGWELWSRRLSALAGSRTPKPPSPGGAALGRPRRGMGKPRWAHLPSSRTARQSIFPESGWSRT